MKHFYKEVEITTSQNELTGKWGATYTLPGEDETNTSFWADDDQSILTFVKGAIDAYQSLVDGTFKFNFPTGLEKQS